MILSPVVHAQEAGRASSAEAQSNETVAVRFVLTPEGGRALPDEGILQLKPADGRPGERIELQVEGREVTARLPPESGWRLSLRIPGFWAPPGVLRVGLEARRVLIPLVATGEVRGRFEVPRHGPELPEYLYVSLESPRANARPRRLGGGRFACPIEEDGSWRCELPVEVLDVVLRVPGFVPVYRWDVRVSGRGALELGEIRLDSGASLAGWVVTEDRRPLPSGIETRLTPRTVAGGDTWTTDRIRKDALTRQVGEDGFFQFGGVPPGEYVLQVEAPGYAEASLPPIGIREASETLLREPVVLRPPIDLVLEIDPPLDFHGRPWLVSALRASEDTGAFDRRPIHKGPMGQGGRLVLPDQTHGLFSVTLRDAEGNVFWKDPFWRVETAEDAIRRIELPLVTVRGEVTLGDEPVPAALWFGGRMGPRRIAVEADEEGLFEGILPEGGDWWVDIVSREHQVKRSLWVEVAPDSEGVAEVEVFLPDTEVHGLVLGPDEIPEPHAQLVIDDSEGGSVTAAADDAGRFRVRGLPPGEIGLVATGKANPSASTGAVATQVQEGATTGPVVLRLLETRTVEGLVVSGGFPVSGAVIRAMPVSGGIGAQARTDVAGRFALDLRADATVVTVEMAPPQGGLTATRVDVSDGEEIVLDAGTDPGSLRVRLPEGDQPPRAEMRLFQDEIRVSGQVLFEWMRSHGAPLLVRETRDFTLPRMAPGVYRLCFGETAGDAPCTSGYLAPGGMLELRLR